jgi:glycerol-3-phosphate dehydrogenase (NAD(P)+)
MANDFTGMSTACGPSRKEPVLGAATSRSYGHAGLCSSALRYGEDMATKVAVIGAGSWGTTAASLASSNVSTVLWARSKELADDMAAHHVNRRYMPEYVFHDRLEVTSSLPEALDGADVVVMAVPSHGFRQVLTEAAPGIAAGAPVVSLSKGLEQTSLKRMTEVVAEVLPGHPTGVLSGPNLAREIMAGRPAATVVAMTDPGVGDDLQAVFTTPSFRVYTNPDVVGCEIAGALKNVMALAAGMSDGMGLGDNTKAALMTRGLAELTRLGVALGGKPLTFGGLAGMGDLVATCMSRQSRNRSVGEELGKGRHIDDIIAEMNMVAEGVKTSRAAVELGRRLGLELPITEQVAGVVNGSRTAADVIPALMQRHTRPELYGIDGGQQQ